MAVDELTGGIRVTCTTAVSTAVDQLRCSSFVGGRGGDAAEVAVFESVAVALEGNDLGVVDPMTRAIAEIDISSARRNRRTSAQSSTLNWAQVPRENDETPGGALRGMPLALQDYVEQMRRRMERLVGEAERREATASLFEPPSAALPGSREPSTPTTILPRVLGFAMLVLPDRMAVAGSTVSAGLRGAAGYSGLTGESAGRW